MTNFERLISDRKRLVELLMNNEEFMTDTAEPGWCGKVCPHKVRCRETEEFHSCFASSEEIIEWWLEQEATD